MADDKSTGQAQGGIGFVGLLTILFIALKLLGKIAWSWWWVLSPIWISAALLVAICAVIAIPAFVYLWWTDDGKPWGKWKS